MKLKLTFDRNTFDNDSGDTLYRWGGKSLKSLDDVREELGLEKNGKTGTIQTPARAA